MPIEIRELHIKMNVNVGANGSGAASQTGSASGRGSDPQAKRAAEEELVARCVEQVMDIIRAKRER
jgi:hypothetical protein